jgi:hypothetical protein
LTKVQKNILYLVNVKHITNTIVLFAVVTAVIRKAGAYIIKMLQ